MNLITKIYLYALMIIVPIQVFAQNFDGPLVFDNPVLGGARTDIFPLIAEILQFVVKVGTVIVIFMVIYSGFLFVKAQGESGKIDEAKNTFFWTVIGGIVLIGAEVLAGVICTTAAGLADGSIKC